MDQSRPGRRVGQKKFNAHEMLSQVSILHHTDPFLARKITRVVLLERSLRGDFREPVLGLKPTNGVLHVTV